jgi:hypothetical protein
MKSNPVRDVRRINNLDTHMPICPYGRSEGTVYLGQAKDLAGKWGNVGPAPRLGNPNNCPTESTPPSDRTRLLLPSNRSTCRGGPVDQRQKCTDDRASELVARVPASAARSPTSIGCQCGAVIMLGRDLKISASLESMRAELILMHRERVKLWARLDGGSENLRQLATTISPLKFLAPPTSYAVDWSAS